MSIVDNRIVNMAFNNAGFEKNAQQSIGTLEKLKQALKFDKAADGLSNLGSAIKNIDLGPISDGIDIITSKFTLVGRVAQNVVDDIAKYISSKISSVGSLIESLSIGQIDAGWDKYAQKTTAVQTIMAATKETWESDAEAMGFAGSQMEYVDDQLNKLNWFTDETSYNFTDMVENIGKFTSTGKSLSESVTAMQGIANWAAISGQNASTASRAMYNLAQALAVGSVKLMDWRSIETANMATMEFKTMAMETAAALGTLTKQADGTFKTMNGATVTAETFSSTLADEWFTSEALLQTLNEYGKTTDKLFKVSEATDLCASQIIGLVESYNELNEAEDGSSEKTELQTKYTKELSDNAKVAGVSVSELAGYVEELGSEEYAFGLKAFIAGQEAKTFADAIEATKDAVSTKWMNIFETLFGNYETAKVVWTELAEFLYGLFASPLDNVNTVLKKWAEFDGRDYFLDFLRGIGPAVETLMQPVTDAFDTIFPKQDSGKTALTLANMTEKAKEFIENFSVGEEVVKKWTTGFAGLFSAIDVVRMAIKDIFKVLSDNAKDGTSAFDGFSNAAQNVGLFFMKLRDYAETGDGFGELGKKLSDVFSAIGSGIKLVGDQLDKITQPLGMIFADPKAAERFGKAVEALGAILDIIAEAINAIVGGFGELFPAFDGAGEGIVALIDHFLEWIIAIRNWVKESQVFQNIVHIIVSILKPALTVGAALFKVLTGSITSMLDASKDGENLNDLSGFISNLADKTVSAVESLKKFTGVFKPILDFFKALWNYLEPLRTAISDFFKNLTETPNNSKIDLGKLSKLTLIFAGLWKLLSGDGGSIGKMFSDIGGSFEKVGKSISSTFGTINKAVKKFTGSKVFEQIAKSMLMLAGAMLILSLVDGEKIGSSLAVLTSFLVELIGTIAALGAVGNGKTFDFQFIDKIGTAMVKLSVSVLILSYALKVLSGIDWKGYAVGIVSLVSVMAILIGALWAMKALELEAPVKGLIALGLGILLMAAALKVFSTISWPDILSGLTAMIFTVGIAVGALVLLSKFAPGALAAAAALLVLSFALLVMAAALMAFTTMLAMSSSGGALGIMLTSLIMMAAILAGMAMFAPGMLAAAGAMLMVAIALAAIGATLVVLTLFDPAKLGNSLMILGLALTAFAAIALVLTPAAPILLSVAGALLLIGVACAVSAASLILLGVACMMFNGLDLATIAEGLTLISGALLLVAAGGVAMAFGIVGLLGGGVALLILAAACLLLSGMDLMNMALALTVFGIAVIALAGGLYILGLAAALLTPVAVVLVAIAAAFLVFGAALMFIVDAAVKIGNAMMQIAMAITAMAISGEKFASVVPDIAKGSKTVIKALKEGLKGFETDVLDIAVDAGQLYGEGIAQGIQNRRDQIIFAAALVADAIEEYNDYIANLGVKLGVNYTDNIVDEIKKKRNNIISAVKNTAPTDASIYNKYYSSGINIVSGLIEGVKSKNDAYVAAIKELATKGNAAFRNTNEIKSPSGVYKNYAKYIVLGLAKGLEDFGYYASNASETLAENTLRPVISATDDFYSMTNEMNSAVKSAFSDVDNLSASLDTTKNVNVRYSFDDLTVRGVNDENEFVAVTRYSIEQMVADAMRRQARI